MRNIKEAIEEKNKEIKKLREQITQAENELDILQKAYRLLSGDIKEVVHQKLPNLFKPISAEHSLADLAEEVLKSAQSPLHVDEILNRIQLQFDMRIKKDSLVAAIARYIKGGRRFKRTKPNIFTLKNESTLRGNDK